MIPEMATLNDRRRELGMTHAALAERSGVSEPTVKRILSGRAEHASYANVVAVAAALGVAIRFHAEPPSRTRQTQAARKARRLVGLVQATSALESQALDDKAKQRLIRASTRALLAGSNRRLWSD